MLPSTNLRKNIYSLQRLPKATKESNESISPENVVKNFLRSNLKKIPEYSKDKSFELSLHKREKKLQSLERIKANREQIQEYK